MEHLLNVEEPNDYVQLARYLHETATHQYDALVEKLESGRIPGTKPVPLNYYEGRYWNEIKNWFIEVSQQIDGELAISMQGLSSQSYTLAHYHHDTFSWLMTFDEIVRRGRGVPFYNAEYYFIRFERTGHDDSFDRLSWNRP